MENDNQLEEDKGNGGEEGRRHMQHQLVNGVEIENVKTMKYLGAMLEEERSCEAEVDHRIGAASKVIGALREEVINRRELSKSTKLRVINATVMPTLLYACVTNTQPLSIHTRRTLHTECCQKHMPMCIHKHTYCMHVPLLTSHMALVG